MVISEFGLFFSSVTKIYPNEVFKLYWWILEVAIGDEEHIKEFMVEMGITLNEGDNLGLTLFDILVQSLVKISENNFEISYSVLTLAVFFYYTILKEWLKSNQEIGGEKTKEAQFFDVIMTTIVPLVLATCEYQYDTIFTDAAKVKRQLPLVYTPALLFLIWNFIQQKFYYKDLVIIPLFEWDSWSSLGAANIFMILQLAIYVCITSIGRDRTTHFRKKLISILLQSGCEPQCLEQIPLSPY